MERDEATWNVTSGTVKMCSYKSWLLCFWIYCFKNIQKQINLNLGKAKQNRITRSPVEGYLLTILLPPSNNTAKGRDVILLPWNYDYIVVGGCDHPPCHAKSIFKFIMSPTAIISQCSFPVHNCSWGYLRELVTDWTAASTACFQLFETWISILQVVILVYVKSHV